MNQVSLRNTARLLLWCCTLGVTLLTGGAAGRAASGDESETRRLFDAVFANDFNAVQASVAAGADVEARDQWGLTPVDYAVDKGNFKIAHFLISRRNQESRALLTKQENARATEEERKSISRAVEQSKAAVAATARAPVSATAAPARNTSPAAWPSDRPNPFDPGTIAPGASGPAPGER